MSDYGHVDLAESPYRVGNTVLIRTVTYFWVGTIVQISETECLLRDASWVADTGRFSRALVTGEFEEIEPVPPKEIVSNTQGKHIAYVMVLKNVDTPDITSETVAIASALYWSWWRAEEMQGRKHVEQGR